MHGVTVFAKCAFTDTWCRRCFQSDETLKRIANKGTGVPELLQLELFNTPASTVRRLIPVTGWPDYHAEQTRSDRKVRTAHADY